MQNRADILRQIEALAAETLDWHGTLTERARLVGDLGLDSLRAMALIVEIENRFEVCFSPEDEGQIDTVGDLVTAVLARRAAGGDDG